MDSDPARTALAAFRQATDCTPELRADNLRGIEARLYGAVPLRRPSTTKRTAIVVLALAAAAIAVWIAGDLSRSVVAVRGEYPRSQAIDAADDGDAPAPTHVATPPVMIPEPPTATEVAPPVSRPRTATTIESPAVVDDADDRLARETRALGEARRALAAGELARAAEQLDALSREFPHGALVEERWALEVQMHCKAGDPDAAAAAASAFARAHARSSIARELAEHPCRAHDSP